MKLTHLFVSVALLASFGLATPSRADSASDRAAVEATGAAIRAAFAAGNVAEIMRYHHPDVRKALSFANVEVGGEAVAAGLQGSLRQFHVEFVEITSRAFSSRAIQRSNRPSSPSRQLL